MLIGLSGQSGVGKDTIADLLKTERYFVKIALADTLKRICKDVFNFSNDQLWGPSEFRNAPDSRYNGLTPRVALQTLGTEWGRALYEDVWIDNAIHSAKMILTEGVWTYSQLDGIKRKHLFDESPAGVVITDVRFKNEIVKIKKAGGFLVRVVRPGFDGSVGIQGHASESEQKTIPDSDFDLIINNDGTTKELFMKVMDMYDALMLKRKKV